MGDVIEILTTATNTVEVEAQGPQGIPGVGVPTGGSALQVLRKKTSTDYDTEWAAAGAGSGSVTSVALASTDLTISGSPITDSGTITANIAANAVTLEKLQTISSEHLLGRHGSGNGGVQQIGLGTGLAISGSNVGVTFGSSAGTACEGNDARLSDSRTPSSHASSHASAGSDPLAPSDIGAQSLFVTEALGTVTANVTLTAARAKIYTLQTNTSGLRILLPASDVLAGDIVQIRFTSATGQSITPVRGTMSGFFTANIGPVGGPVTFIAASASGTSWAVAPVDRHIHGNIGDQGNIGTTSGLPIKTGDSGVLEAGAFGTSAGQFAEGNDSRITGAIQSSIIDAKGDLLVGTADNTLARLAVGATNGHVLQIDSSTATGLKWAASSGGLNAMQSIAINFVIN